MSEFTFERIDPRDTQAVAAVRDECEEILRESYEEPAALFQEGVDSWSRFIVVRDGDGLVGFQGWSVAPLVLATRTVVAVRMRIGAIHPRRRGRGLAKRISKPVYLAGMDDAAVCAASPRFPDVVAWGLAASPMTLAGTEAMFPECFWPNRRPLPTTVREVAVAIRRSLRVAQHDGEPMVVRGVVPHRYRAAELETQKRAQSALQVPVLSEHDVRTDAGDRVLMVFGRHSQSSIESMDPLDASATGTGV